jgi:hypothetical protein
MPAAVNTTILCTIYYTPKISINVELDNLWTKKLFYFCYFRYGSVLILGCELSAGDVVIVFLSVVNGSFTLGNALPKLEAFAAALGSATVIFEIIDRVLNRKT